MKRAATPSTSRKGRKGPGSGYLTGQLLIAMPQMQDARFHRSVLYICAHSSDGAMGLVINKVLDSLTLAEMIAHLDVPTDAPVQPEKIHVGGPVETARGFVLHSADYIDDGTQIVGHGLALT